MEGLAIMESFAERWDGRRWLSRWTSPHPRRWEDLVNQPQTEMKLEANGAAKVPGTVSCSRLQRDSTRVRLRAAFVMRDDAPTLQSTLCHFSTSMEWDGSLVSLPLLKLLIVSSAILTCGTPVSYSLLVAMESAARCHAWAVLFFTAEGSASLTVCASVVSKLGLQGC